LLLNLETLCYFSLNKTGVAVWREIEKGSPLSLDEITTLICERFDVGEAAAQIDARAFLEHLARFKTVRMS